MTCANTGRILVAEGPEAVTPQIEAALSQAVSSADSARLSSSRARAAESRSVTAEVNSAADRRVAELSASQAFEDANLARQAMLEARGIAEVLSELAYDMGTLDQPADGSADFDFGSL